jgi:hypothetical protein
MASPKVADRKALPPLVGWTAVPVAGQETEMSRQWIFDLITSGKIKTARQIPGTGDRPAAIVMRTAEVEELKRLRQAAQTCDRCRKLRNQGKQPGICEHETRAEIRVPEEDLEAAALGV